MSNNTVCGFPSRRILRAEMKITQAQIDRIRMSYEQNKIELNQLETYISENGCTDEGLSDVSISFEQGYNNALEFVFSTLGV